MSSDTQTDTKEELEPQELSVKEEFMKIEKDVRISRLDLKNSRSEVYFSRSVYLVAFVMIVVLGYTIVSGINGNKTPNMTQPSVKTEKELEKEKKPLIAESTSTESEPSQEAASENQESQENPKNSESTQLESSKKEEVKEEIKKEAKEHEVKEGETLFNIAMKYEIKVEELLAWNNLPDNTIHVGQVLIVSN